MYKLTSSKEKELTFTPGNHTVFTIKIIATVIFFVVLVIYAPKVLSYVLTTGHIEGDGNSLITVIICLGLFIASFVFTVLHRKLFFVFMKDPEVFEIRAKGTLTKKTNIEETVPLTGLIDIKPKSFLRRMYQDAEAGSVDVSYDIFIALIFENNPDVLLNVYYLNDNHARVKKQRADLLKRLNRFILQIKKYYNLSDLSDQDYEEITITERDRAKEEERYISL